MILSTEGGTGLAGKLPNLFKGQKVCSLPIDLVHSGFFNRIIGPVFPADCESEQRRNIPGYLAASAIAAPDDDPLS
jgi:hypothetical protein